MTPRERWLALLAGETPDRVPTDFWATGEVIERLIRELDCGSLEGVWDRLHIDAPRSLGAPRTQTHHPDDPSADIWGVRSRHIAHSTGAYSETGSHPLADCESADEVHAWNWPSPEDHDFGALEARFADVPDDRPIRCGGYEPFLLYCRMRGMEQAMIDLIAEPEIAEAIFGRIFEYYYALNRRMFEIGGDRIDLFYLAEDLGSQQAPLLSPELVERWIFPNQKRMADLARSFGIHLFYHTDGAARTFIPGLIDEVGIEILNPIQWRCPGMEREGLVRDFADRVIFHGAVDNQETLPFGTPEDVRREVRENVEIFAPARWICAPCHNIQPNTPTANILALYETIHQVGRN